MTESRTAEGPSDARSSEAGASEAGLSEAGPSEAGTPESSAGDSRRWWALLVIGIAQLMVVLDATIVNVALPSAQAELGISDANRQWIVTAYSIAFGGLLLLGGRIADYGGRKRALLIGLAGFAVASGLGGLAQDQAQLYAARALQGAFAALLAPAALALITVTFVLPKERAKAFGVYGAISGGGAALGLILGGVLTEYFSWRWTLGINIPIAIITALLAIPLIRESKAQGDTRYDIPGAITVTGGLVALVYGISRAGVIGWGATETILLFVLAAALLAAFVLIESRSPHPLLPFRVISERTRAGSFVAMFITGAGLFAMFLFLTYYFQGVLGYSALKTGMYFLPFSAGIIVSAGITSQLLPKVGPRLLTTVGLLLAASGMVWLTTLPLESAFLTHILPSELLLSFGMGLVFVSLSSSALHGVDAHDAGVASALLNTSQQVGGSLGTALLNTIATSATAAFLVGKEVTPELVAEGTVAGFDQAYWWSAALLIIAAVVCWITLRGAKANHVEGVPVA